MRTVYKTSLFQVGYNLLLGAFVGLGVALVIGYFFEVLPGIAAGVVMFLLYLWLVVFGGLLTITVEGNRMTVNQGRKESTFELDQCNILAQTKRSGADTDCSLSITDAQGEVHHVDCQLLGASKFYQLLETIGVIGENAPVNKIQTKR